MTDLTKLTVMQLLPSLDAGGVERGSLEIAEALVKRGHRSIVVSAGGKLLEELLDKGSEHYTMTIGKKSLTTLRHINGLRQLIKETRTNIIHARSRLPAWISYLAWKSMHKRERPHFITTVHGHYSVNRYSKIMTAGEHVIAISEHIKEYITSNYPDTSLDKLVVIPRGVNPEQYQYGFKPDSTWLKHWHTEYPVLKGKVIICLPGRMTRRKGHEDFLKIITRLPTRYQHIHGLIVGGPHPGKQPYYKELINRTDALGLQNRITFTGHRSDLREIMSTCSMVMSLSYEPEAFGRTALEALSMGIPVIAYSHGGAGEILNRIFPAGLIEKNDINSAVNLITLFADNAPVVPDINPYTLNRMLDATVDLYERVSGLSLSALSSTD